MFYDEDIECNYCPIKDGECEKLFSNDYDCSNCVLHKEFKIFLDNGGYNENRKTWIIF